MTTDHLTAAMSEVMERCLQTYSAKLVETVRASVELVGRARAS